MFGRDPAGFSIFDTAEVVQVLYVPSTGPCRLTERFWHLLRITEAFVWRVV
jgi:hypothetical protein